MRQNFATRKQLKEREQEEKAGGPHPPIVGLTSSYSLHDFHNFSVQVAYRQSRIGANSVVEPEPQEEQLFASAEPKPECIPGPDPVPDPNLDPDPT